MSHKHTIIIIHYKYATLLTQVVRMKRRSCMREGANVMFVIRQKERRGKSNVCRRRRHRTAISHAPGKYYPSHVFTVFKRTHGLPLSSTRLAAGCSVSFPLPTIFQSPTSLDSLRYMTLSSSLGLVILFTSMALFSPPSFRFQYHSLSSSI